MSVTLAQAALMADNDIDRRVIDEFRKSNWLFENIEFDDAVNPQGGGATLTYGYLRVLAESSAGFRPINKEYSPDEATKEPVTVNLRPLGGAFKIDRVLDAVARGRETAFQIAQKVKGARAAFNDAFINGQISTDSEAGDTGFEGLNLIVDGTAQEITLDVSLNDWSVIADASDGFKVMEGLDTLLAALDGPASAILANRATLTKIIAAARRAGYLTSSEDAFGRQVRAYNGVPLVDLGAKAGSSADIISVSGGLTDVYAVRLGIDGVHAVSLAGQAPVRTYMPDFNTPGAVKTGEVEMVTAVAVKAQKSVAVLRGVKIAAS